MVILFNSLKLPLQNTLKSLPYNLKNSNKHFDHISISIGLFLFYSNGSKISRIYSIIEL